METTNTKFIDIKEVKRDWHLVDAKRKTLGRLASQISRYLQGKHKVEYAPHMDVGDYVLVINARDVKITGKKLVQKYYYHYSGYPGGLKATPLIKVLEKHPERVLEKAVRLMLPKTTLGRKMYRRLKVYAGPLHPHSAQEPLPVDITKERREA